MEGVGIIDAIRSYTNIKEKALLVSLICIVGLADIGCAISLYTEIHSGSPGSWTARAILNNLLDRENFTQDSADILLLVISRLSFLPLVAALAISKGKPPDVAPSTRGSNDNGRHRRSLLSRIFCCHWLSGSNNQDNDNNRNGDAGKSAQQGSNGAKTRRGRALFDLDVIEGAPDGAGLLLPLLREEDSSDDGNDGDMIHSNGGHARSSLNGDVSGAVGRQHPNIASSGGMGSRGERRRAGGQGSQQRAKDAERALIAAKTRAKWNKKLFLGGMYVFSTLMQVYTGVKCVKFRFNHERVEGPLMGLGVLWLNLLSWALGELVSASTKEEGLMKLSLHSHRLYKTHENVSHRCDECRAMIKEKDGESWRCNLCDYDVCLLCFSKENNREGALRGDKGIRVESDLSTTSYFNRAISLARPHWPFFSVAFLCLGVSNSANIAMPNFQGKILDSVVLADAGAFQHSLVLYVILSAVNSALKGVNSLCFNIAGRKMATGARIKLFWGTITQDVAFFDGTTTGKLTSLLTQDVGAMVSPCRYMLGRLFSSLILLLGGLIMCFVTSWRLSMLAFTSIVPMYHITNMYAKWSQGINKQIYGAYAEANGCATEALSNVRTVKAMSTEKLEVDRFTTETLVALKKGIKDAIASGATDILTGYLDQGASALIFWYGGMLAMDGEDRLTAGKLITYQLYWVMVTNAWDNLIGIVSSFTQAAGAAQRVFALMDSLPDIDIDKGECLDDQTFKGEITLQSVRFHYQMRPDNEVLCGVDLHIPGGSTCALVGRSGGGKSTLVHLLLRFYDPRAGRILIDGRPLVDLNVSSLRHRVAIVAQDTQLFARTVYENITYGLDEESFSKEDVYEAARKACAHDFITAFPDGYQTRVGERGTRLSGGQKQRVAIARALLRNPRILLLDEATSALDSESEGLVQEALDGLMRKGAGRTTVVLVAHRLSTVMNAHNIAVMDKGRCIEQGTHDTLMKTKGVYSQLVARQVARQANTLEQDQSGKKAKAGPVDIDTLLEELAEKVEDKES